MQNTNKSVLQIQNIQMRKFAASFASKDEYETIQQDQFYKPINNVHFQSNQLLIFDGVTSKERRFVPWEVKEATIKNSLGLLGVYMFDILFPSI